MEDPIQRHPTRTEQLDILTTVMADAAPEGRARVLDLGCGTGYTLHHLMRKRPGLEVVGVDLKPESLEQAKANLAGLDGVFHPVAGDLGDPGSIELPGGEFDLACTCLTFHDLTAPAKQAMIDWVAGRLAPSGYFFIYDRVRLEEPALFDLQRSIWARIEDRYGRAMRTAESFEAYRADLGEGNDPASLEDYLGWYRAAGLAPACLHLHGNVALLAGARGARAG